MKQNNLSEITFDVIYDTIQLVLDSPITTRAPLGYSSSSIMLYGESRKSEVSMRNHSGCVEMLLTNPDGKFIYLGKLAKELPTGFIAGSFYETFKSLSAYVVGGFDEVLTEERS